MTNNVFNGMKKIYATINKYFVFDSGIGKIYEISILSKYFIHMSYDKATYDYWTNILNLEMIDDGYYNFKIETDKYIVMDYNR